MNSESLAAYRRFWLSALLALCLFPAALALEPPTAAELARYRQDGSLAARVEAARSLGNQNFAPHLLRRAADRLEYAARCGRWPDAAAATALPPGQPGMPSSGPVNVLALLVAFSDQPPVTGADRVHQRLFGEGIGNLPCDSLRNYYRRSSYEQLFIQGQTLGWYTTSYPRSQVAKTQAGREQLVLEALQHYDDQGFDFSPYDNDGNGVIDYLVVIWTGPREGWSDFWWGYQTEFGDRSALLDGKRLGLYSWQWETANPPQEFLPNTVIHETGHALGLPDYYDYDDGVGPLGGVGGMDIMDGARGEHNGFSKFMLGWLSPSVLNRQDQALTLRPSGTYPEALIVMPEYSPERPFAEFYLLQNRWRVANDTTLPGQGLVVWHIDARLDDWRNLFAWNNSYTPHKLIRLMEADGLEEIESGGSADTGDFYVAGRTFGPATSPGSGRYDGSATGVTVRNISVSGSNVSLEVAFAYQDGTPPTGSPTAPAGVLLTAPAPVLQFSWQAGSAADPESGLAGYELEIRREDTGATIFDEYVGNVLTRTFHHLADGASYAARVRACNRSGVAGEWTAWGAPVAVALPPFCATLDQCGLDWTLGGFSPWYTVTDGTAPSAPTALHSGRIPGNARTDLSTTVTGPGHLSFWWKVSSEQECDYLSFYLDQDVRLAVSGEVGWTPCAVDIPAGEHVLTWSYGKDSALDAGQDAGWLDRVVFYRLAGDLDLSGTVDALDLLVLAHALAGNLSCGQAPFLASPEAGDLDGSGVLDAADLALLRDLLSGSR